MYSYVYSFFGIYEYIFHVSLCLPVAYLKLYFCKTFIYLFFISFCMPLNRKVRQVGSSLVITIPRHLAIAYGIKNGTVMTFMLGSDGNLVLKKGDE